MLGKSSAAEEATPGDRVDYFGSTVSSRVGGGRLAAACRWSRSPSSRHTADRMSRQSARRAGLHGLAVPGGVHRRPQQRHDLVRRAAHRRDPSPQHLRRARHARLDGAQPPDRGRAGLLGLALHPNYPTSPFLYAYATRNIGGMPTNQILRITLVGRRRCLADGDHERSRRRRHHNSGRITFGPDGFLYAVVGEHGNAANSQTINGNTNLAGKVLRIGPNGAVPADNPFPGSYVWAYGIRNSFGFAFDPVQGDLWLNDNGPTCNDEVNRIVKGGNHAWGPEAVCTSPPAAPQNTNQSGPQPRRLPQHFYADSAGITGAVFCRVCQIGRNGRAAGRQRHHRRGAQPDARCVAHERRGRRVALRPSERRALDGDASGPADLLQRHRRIYRLTAFG